MAYIWYNIQNHTKLCKTIQKKKEVCFMAYHGSSNHGSFVEKSKEARAKGLNYGMHVGLEEMEMHLSIKDKIRMMKNAGTFTYEKVKDRIAAKEKVNLEESMQGDKVDE